MDKLQMQSKNLVDENIEFIAKRFPNCVTEALDEEGKLTKLVDFDMLKQELSHVVIDGDKERYTMTWPDKRKAILTANVPIAKTLRPCREESVDFDHTQNLYVEGDNLDVLKLLRETYLGKIKMIYIDPPYNTGNDFVYNDDFSDASENFLKRDNQKNDGLQMVQNLETNGRFHTDWLNMIYPRLKLAKDLLTDNGVIFISIDENEITNLKKVCDEIFGSRNYVNTFCWLNNLKGRQISNTGAVKTYEYILCYSKQYENVELFQANVEYLKKLMPSAYKGFNYATEKDDHGAYVIKNELYNTNSIFNEETRPNLVFCIHYNPVSGDIKFSKPEDDVNYPGYTKIYPKKNNNGTHKWQAWRWSQNKIQNESYDLAFIPFENTYKIYTKIRDFNITNVKDIITDIGNGNSEIDKIFEHSGVFSYPKSTDLLKLFISCLDDSDSHSIVLDFFSGSGTTADAVLRFNQENSKQYRFICVQLPEICDTASEAKKLGYNNLCDVAKERIRRAGKKIKEEDPNATGLDIGFRDLKLDSSCMKDIYYSPNKTTQDLLTQFEDNIKEDRTPEDLLFQVMLDMGVMLSSEIKTLEINGKKVFNVNDGDLVCCFDKNLNDDVVTAIAKTQPLYAVFRDASMSTDSVSVNFDQIFETYSPTTTRKII